MAEYLTRVCKKVCESAGNLKGQPGRCVPTKIKNYRESFSG